MEDQIIKEKILKGAETLFMKYGVRSISMDDIARHLSVSKKTLYLHFADKEDIVTLTFKAYMDFSLKEFDAIKNDAKNAIEELANISVCIRKSMETMNPSLLFDLQKYHPKAWGVWIEHKNRIIRDSVVRNLKQGIEEGNFRPEINPDILALMRMELVQLAFNDQMFPQDQFKLTEVQMQLFDHFVYGVVTDKGRKLYQKYKDVNQENPLTL